MKRLVLLFASLLIGITTATATELNNQKQKHTFNKTKNYRYAQPIVFIEHGIEFLIFHDGTFDFNTSNTHTPRNNTYYKYGNSSRSSVNTIFYSSKSYRNSNNSCSNENSISRDRDGKVKRIGNVHLNYGRYGKITRAGNIKINYGRGHFGELQQVGGLHVNYNHYGEITNAYGQVNRYNRYQYYFKNKKSKNKHHRHADDRRYNERNYRSKRHSKSKKR